MTFDKRAITAALQNMSVFCFLDIYVYHLIFPYSFLACFCDDVKIKYICLYIHNIWHFWECGGHCKYLTHANLKIKQLSNLQF